MLVTSPMMFPGFHLQPDIKETQLGSSDQKGSPSVGKNTTANLGPCCTWKSDPISISGDMDVPESLGVAYCTK